jgi:two-component system response regulator YesN
MKKVLISDDEIEIVEFLSSFLKRKKVHVSIATDGNQALELFELHSPDLTLLDIGMPTLNGLQVLKKIKKKNPRAKVIMVTGKGDKESMAAADKLGADGYLTKPLELSELYSIVSKFLTPNEN